jgi:hypothetical protein
MWVIQEFARVEYWSAWNISGCEQFSDFVLG